MLFLYTCWINPYVSIKCMSFLFFLLQWVCEVYLGLKDSAERWNKKQTTNSHGWSIIVLLYMFLHRWNSHLHSLRCFWTMQTWAVINPTVSIFVFRFSLNFLPESLVYMQWRLPVPWRILNALHTRQLQSDSHYVCECKQQLWIDLKSVMKNKQ